MKRYTILSWLRLCNAALAAIWGAAFLDLVKRILTGNGFWNGLAVIADIVLFIYCLVFLWMYLYQIRPSVASLKKAYDDFIRGKSSRLEIMPATHMFFREEENLLNYINELIDREEYFATTNKQAEYLVLQNQINLHFLYNALESIRGDAISSGITSMAEAVQALSSFFRYTISDMQGLVTVEEELESIHNYFLVQQYRFGQELTLKIQFMGNEKEICSLKIPKLILQPIVENSVYHGVEAQEHRGNILITLDQTETHLYISVKDNGKGIPEKELQELNRYLNEMTFKPDEKYRIEQKRRKKNGHNGIALKNVAQRIKLYFGNEYGIFLFSTVEIGTTVKIVVPRQESGSMDVKRR